MTDQKIIIRKARESDYEAINAMVSADMVEYKKIYPEKYRDDLSRPLGRGSFINSIDSYEKDWKYFVAEKSGHVIGFIELEVISGEGNRIRKSSKYVNVNELLVAPDSHRQGAGTLLMKQAETWARQRKISQLYLDVFHFRQPAQALYASLGYKSYTQTLRKTLDK